MRPDDPAVSATPIDLPASDRPTLFMVVDTEEEFDWSAPFSRQSTGVTAMRHIGRAQLHEEPIVCTPDDAIRAFLQGNLDYLAIGSCLVAHPSMRH